MANTKSEEGVSKEISKFRQNSINAWNNALGSDSLGGTLGAIGSGLTGVVSAGLSNAQIADTTDIENNIADTANQYFDFEDYDSLMSSYNPYSIQGTNLGRKDVRGLTGGQMALNTGKGVLSGAQAGAQIGGPIGAAVGAVAGLGSGLTGIFVGNSKADKRAAQLNADAANANLRYLTNYSNNAKNISENMFNDAAIHIAAEGGKIKSKSPKYYGFDDYFAYGGDLNLSGDWSNGVTIVGEGGTHEENKYEGVPMGVDENGVPNLVEEGEVIFNDYVFSNRINATEKQLEDVNLNKRYAGKSMSEIAKLIQKESSENPFDPISRNTLEDGMSKLMTIQEDIRAKKEMRRQQRMFAKGGLINKFVDGGYNWRDFANTIDNYRTSLNSRSGNFYDYTRSYTPQQVANIEEAQSYKDFTNYVLNNSNDPNVLNYLKQLDLNTANNSDKLFNGNSLVDNWADLYNSRRNDGKYGVYHINPELGLTPLEVRSNIKTSPFATSDNITNDIKVPSVDERRTQYLSENPDTSTNIENTNNDAVDWMRFAPVVGSGLQVLSDALGKTNKVDYTNPNLIRRAARNIRDISPRPVGPYMTYNPFDTNYEQNRLANQSLATRNAILGSSSGNRSAAVANLLALNNSTNNQMGNLYRTATDANDQQRKAVTQFNLGVSQFNSQMGMQADAYNQRADIERLDASIKEAMLRDQIESAMSSAKSTNLSNFTQNLYNLGMDRYYAGQAGWWGNNVAPVNNATKQYSWYSRGNGGKIRRGFTF